MADIDLITLQLHYSFTEENSHSMNARVHNECDKYFIQAVQILNKYIDEPFDIIVYAKDEGGLKDLYKILIKDPGFYLLLTYLLASSSTQFFTSNFRPAIPVTEETKAKIENVEKIKELIKGGNLTEIELDYILSNDKELKKLKSNFYKAAKKEVTINSIEVEALNKNNIPIFEKKSIDYSEFDNCILSEDEQTNTGTVDAKIYIVSPILTKGRKDHWKGIWDETSIDFKVSDKLFLEYVYKHIIKFGNGTYINCKMEVKTTISSIDGKDKISRDVIEVYNWADDEKLIRNIVKRKDRGDSRTAYDDQTLNFQ